MVTHTDSNMMMGGKFGEFVDIRESFSPQDSYAAVTSAVMWNKEFMIYMQWRSNTPCMELFMSRDE